MKGPLSNSKATRGEDVLFLPASAKTVPQDKVDALEAKRLRVLRELGNWRPSGGWHIEPAV